MNNENEINSFNKYELGIVCSLLNIPSTYILLMLAGCQRIGWLGDTV